MKTEFQRTPSWLPSPSDPMYGLRLGLQWDWRWIVLLSLACAVYVGLALSPSSYALGLERLGQTATGTWLGSPRGIRSDEWMVYTPYMQIAVENSFQRINALSPYQEDLRTFQALPLLDWALLFKPYHWGFFVAAPAYGYSFYFFFMATAFLAGWALFVRKLGLSVWIAVPVAVSLYFSQYVQVWWTTNAGAFSLAPWVALAWMYSGHRLLRIALTAYAITAWMLACAYPPFLYSIALAIGGLIIAFRREAISLRSLYDATIAGSIAIALFIGYFHELIDIMQQTVYPGRRVAVSGSVGLERLLAQLSPTALIHGFEPLARIKGTNACEIAVLSTLLPMYAAALADHRAFATWLTRNRLTLIILCTTLAVFMAWMFLSVHPVLARISGLYLVPPARALVGFGLVLNIVAAAYIAISGIRVSVSRALATMALVGIALWVKASWSGTDFAGTFSYLDAVLPLATIALLVGLALLRAATARTVLTLWVVAAANVAMFGTFNPVQRTHAIFDVDRDAVRATLETEGARTDRNGAMVALGHYGALIPGAGVPSINHVLYTPQLAFFRRHFPDMEEARFNEVFNRYAHVIVNEAPEPSLLSPDSLSVPWHVMVDGEASTEPSAVQIEQLAERPEAAADAAFGHIDSVSISDSSRLEIVGWSRTPLESDAAVGLWSNARIENLVIRRQHRADVGASVSQDLAQSGFVIEGELSVGSDENAMLCLVVLRGQAIDTALVFPDGRRDCVSLFALAN